MKGANTSIKIIHVHTYEVAKQKRKSVSEVVALDDKLRVHVLREIRKGSVLYYEANNN